MFRQIKGCGNLILDDIEHQSKSKKHRQRLRKVSPNESLVKILESSQV